VANEPGISTAQLAIAWILREANVASALVGASRPEQIEENVKASDITLDLDILSQLPSLTRSTELP